MPEEGKATKRGTASTRRQSPEAPKPPGTEPHLETKDCGSQPQRQGQLKDPPCDEEGQALEGDEEGEHGLHDDEEGQHLGLVAEGT